MIPTEMQSPVSFWCLNETKTETCVSRMHNRAYILKAAVKTLCLFLFSYLGGVAAAAIAGSDRLFAQSRKSEGIMITE